MSAKKYGLILLVIANMVKLPFVGGCEVQISSPWKPLTFVPLNSYTLVSCNDTEYFKNKVAESDEKVLEWSIKLPDREVDYTFNTVRRKQILNSRGIYELSGVTIKELTTIWLAINDTKLNISGTVLRCENIDTGEIVESTTIIVYKPAPIIITKVSDNYDHLQATNLSWSSPELPNIFSYADLDILYSLTVVPDSGSSSQQAFDLHETFFEYYAPEDAPPCEVYNFSVTATYVGATYTGAGCSVPSPVLSTMLPSLPDIDSMQSSVMYSLEKQSSGRITLIVSFKSAIVCQGYPVNSYVLNLQGPKSPTFSPIKFDSSKQLIITDEYYLSDNEIYKFNISVSNAVGSVSTNATTLYTSDVQSVTVAPLRGTESVTIECTFIKGSQARGCMVKLVGELYNTTVNLTGSGLCLTTKVDNLTHVLSQSSDVFGYDIESDWSVGTLPVPALILKNGSDLISCVLDEMNLSSTSSQFDFPLWVIGVITVVVLLTLTILLLILVCTTISCRKARRKRSNSENAAIHVTSPAISPLSSTKACNDLELETSMKVDDTQHYSLPDMKQAHTAIQEPFYHVLENPNQNDLIKSKHLNGHGNGSGMTVAFSSELVHNNGEVGPIYQDICEFSSTKASNQRAALHQVENGNCCQHPSERNIYEHIPTDETNV